MTRKAQLFSASALVTLITASTALADVTALQVWDDWQAMLGRTGTTVDFDQSISGGILTINNLSLTTIQTTADGDKNKASMINLGSLVFQDQGDGTVMVLLPTDAPIVIKDGRNEITLNQSHKDLSLLISGAPKDLTYTYKAAELTLTLVEVLDAGQRINDLSAEVTLADVNGSTHNMSGPLLQVEQDNTIGAVTYAVDFKDAANDMAFSSHGVLAGLKSNFDMAIPEDVKTGSIQDALDAGLKMLGHMGYSDFTGSLMVNDAGDLTNATLSSKQAAVSFNLSQSTSDNVAIVQDITFGPITVHSLTKNPRIGNKLEFDLSLAQIGTSMNVSYPETFQQDSFDKLEFSETLDTGLSMKFGFGYSGLDGQFSGMVNGKPASGSIQSASSGIDLSLDRNAFLYSADSGTFEVKATTPELPIGPIEMSMSGVSSNWVIPLKVSDKPEAFSIVEKASNLTISENLWALFDPDGVIPRGPLSYVLDVSGTSNWLIDPFSKAFQNSPMNQTKGQLHSLALNEFMLTVAGVDLTGAGGFTFNNDDLETFKGIPAPTGALDLKLIGVNALIDGLIKLGLVEEDEAMGARMGLGLFTVAGDGEDTLISHIETTDDGHVLANGKRLK